MSAIQLFREHGVGKSGSTKFRGSLADRRRARSEARFRELLARRFVGYVEAELMPANKFDAIVDRIAARELDPYTAVGDVMARLNHS